MDLDLDVWIDRLRTGNLPDLRGIDGAAELAAVKQGSVITPYAWVIPVAEDSGNNQLLTAISQRTVERVGIVIAVSNKRDARGLAAHNALRTIRRAIKGRLLGWPPAPDEDEVIFSRGRLVSYTNQVLWWQDEYLSAFEERVV